MKIFFAAFLLSAVALGFQNKSRECVKRDDKNQDVSMIFDWKWIKDSLEVHNKFRELHDSPPLKLNRDLCRSAQWVANKNCKKKCEDRNMSAIEIQKVPKIRMSCGENLHSMILWKFNLTQTQPEIPVTLWYSQVRKYKFPKDSEDTPSNLSGVENFVNIVWKDTKEMCITYANVSCGGYAFFVAHYYPTRNVGGEFRANIKPTAAGLGSISGSSSSNFKYWRNFLNNFLGVILLTVSSGYWIRVSRVNT